VRVVQLAGFSRHFGGSFIPMLRGIVAATTRRGWEAEAVFPAEASAAPWVPELEDAGAQVRFVERGGRREATRWLSDALEGWPGRTILHSHFTDYDLPAIRAARGRDDVRVVWHVHTVLNSNPRAVGSHLVKLALARRYVDAIICPAENVSDALRRRGAPADRLHLFPSPIELADFPLADGELRRRGREQLGLPADAEVLLHFAWHPSIKGTDRFLAAVAQLKRSPDRRPLAVVRGQEEAEALCRRAGLGETVRIQKPVEDITLLYAASDVLVAPSRREGMPFTLVEALACGTPVIASRLPGHTYLGDHVAACRITDTEPTALAATIASVLDRDPEQALNEARDARAWIEANLSLPVAAERMLDLYETL
jgi:glycosyltransferase involved in cell wall biosynthesis